MVDENREHVLMAALSMGPVWTSTPIASTTDFAPDYRLYRTKVLAKPMTGLEGQSYEVMGMTPGVDTTTITVGASTLLYRIRGWYSAGSVFEVWVGSSPYDAPPSGHTLLDISFVPFNVG